MKPYVYTFVSGGLFSFMCVEAGKRDWLNAGLDLVGVLVMLSAAVLHNTQPKDGQP